MSYVLIFGGYLRGTVSLHLLHLGQRGNVSIGNCSISMDLSLFVDTQVFVMEVLTDIETTQKRITVRMVLNRFSSCSQK